mmetsp:Transcript_21174/g.29362  ORF Transcript_21174/g.29362 Transcript_21174/m.29362 type:complete len:201 (+) Transcript_21174:2128-2730(+)
MCDLRSSHDVVHEHLVYQISHKESQAECIHRTMIKRIGHVGPNVFFPKHIRMEQSRDGRKAFQEPPLTEQIEAITNSFQTIFCEHAARQRVRHPPSGAPGCIRKVEVDNGANLRRRQTPNFRELNFYTKKLGVGSRSSRHAYFEKSGVLGSWRVYAQFGDRDGGKFVELCSNVDIVICQHWHFKPQENATLGWREAVPCS